MANPVDRNALANTLMTLFRGGAGGPRGDPYANESAGPFAQSPRIYARPQPGAPPAAAAAAAVPVPAKRPKGGAGKAKVKAPTGPNNMPVGMPDPATATSPSSLLQSPELNATSPSSLIQSPPAATGPSPMPYGGPMAAADNAPQNPIERAAMAMNPNPGQNPLGLGGYNPLTNAVDQAPRRRPPFIPTPLTGVPGGAITPGGVNQSSLGPNYADFWRLMQGGSGRGQTSY